MHRIMKLALLSLVCLTACFGQASATGTISGRVTDSSGAVIPAANVVATNLATGARYTAATSSDGLYTLQFILPGKYSVEVSHAGFLKALQPQVDVIAASNPTVDVVMTVGSVSETVNVSGRISLVEFENSDRSGEIDQPRTQYTPTTGRVIDTIFTSVPGVFLSGGDRGMVPSGNSGTTQFTINGGQDRSNQMLLDGVPNRVSQGGFTFGTIPTQEAVAEFKVITNPYSAEYGSTTGGVINVITKSGANAYHGELFSYIRNTIFDANQFERNLAGQPRTDLKYNTYGGVATGRIIRNKLFFTFQLQKNRAVNPKPLLGYVPTDAQRQGNFSTTLYNSGGVPTPIRIYDPFTTTFDSSTGRYTRLPFANSVIPTSRINPVARNLWQYIPEPNITATSPYPQSNYIPARSGNLSTLDFYNWMPRIDWNISDRQKLMVRYTRNTDTEWQGLFYNTPAEPNGSSPFVRSNHNFAVDYTRTLSPSSVLDFRVGMERFVQGQTPNLRGKVTPKDLGFSPTFVSEAAPAFPYFIFAGANLAWLGGNVFSGAGSAAQSYTINQLNNVDLTWSKVFGRHNLKVGGQVLPERLYSVTAGFNAGSFLFSSVDTAGPDPQVQQAGAGSELASFLTGVGTGLIDQNSQPARQILTESLFVQDSIKLSRRLTVNVGLRWDHVGSLTDRFNAMTGIFDPKAVSPLAAAVKSAAGAGACPACADLRGGLTFPGVSGADRTIYNTGYRDFAPRIAVAYGLDSKSVLRAGYGYFYGATGSYDPGSAGFSQPTPWNAYNANQVPVNTLENPFPTGLVPPVGAAKGLATNIGAAVSFIDPNTRTPRSQQFSFELQREIPWKIRLSGAYVNNRVDRLPVSQSLDALTEQQFVQGATVLNQRVSNPFSGLAPGFNLNQSTIAVSSLIVPYPQFTSVTELDRPIGSSRYDAMQIYAVKQFTNGISFSLAYTVSKMLVKTRYQYPTDPTLEKTLSTFDSPQTLVPNFVAELPFGRNHRLASQAPRWLDSIIGGWQFSGIVRIQKGLPVSMNVNAVPTGADPNAVPGGQNLNHWINPAAFTYNTNAFIPRRWPIILSSLRSPPIHRFDLSLTKKLKVTERVKWELVAEAPNAFNTPEFWTSPASSSGLDPRSPTFGVIAGLDAISNAPRQLQLGSRITF